MHVRELIEKNYPQYYGWFDYPSEGTVAFTDTRSEWGILGNFASVHLMVDGVPFSSTESLFQIMKFSDPGARKAIYAKKGMPLKWEAKHFEKTVGVREDWGEIIVDVLKFCLVTKYSQSEEFRSELLRTGDRPIVEVAPSNKSRPDTYNVKLSPDGKTWSGPNLMGRLLMELRDKGTLEYSLPEDAMKFPDLRETSRGVGNA